MDEPIPCPQCGAPAQITERFRLASTVGVRHLYATCTRSGPRWPQPPARTGRGGSKEEP